MVLNLRAAYVFLLIMMLKNACYARDRMSSSRAEGGIRPSDIVVVTGIGFERYEIIEATRAFRYVAGVK